MQVRSWDSNAVLPSTGLAAHADDDLVENDDEKQPSTDVKSDEKIRSETSKVLPLVINSSQVPSSNLPKVSSMAPTQYAQVSSLACLFNVTFVKKTACILNKATILSFPP